MASTSLLRSVRMMRGPVISNRGAMGHPIRVLVAEEKVSAATCIPGRKHLSSSSRQLYARKGSQDRESIDRESTEYSKSGTDEQSAAQEEAAFDPSTTDPKKEKDVAGKGEKGNPLEFSPANPEVSKPKNVGGEKGGSGKE